MNFIFDKPEIFQNIAGVSIDNINSDDFEGVCLEGVPFPLTRTLMCGIERNAELLDFCTLPSNFSQILALTNPDYNLSSPFQNNSLAYYEGDDIKKQIKRKVSEKLLLENFQVSDYWNSKIFMDLDCWIPICSILDNCIIFSCYSKLVCKIPTTIQILV